MVIRADVRDYPLMPNERAILDRIVGLTGWGSAWCEESIRIMSTACVMSAEAVRKAQSFLVGAHVLENRQRPGYPTAYRALMPHVWVPADQLPSLRAKIYKGEFCNLVSLTAHEEKKAEQYSAQPRLTAATAIDEFELTRPMVDWAEENAGNVDIEAVTSSFLAECRLKVESGWRADQVDLEKEWRARVLKASARPRATGTGDALPFQATAPAAAAMPEIADPSSHPAVQIVSQIFKKVPNIPGQEQIASTVTDLFLWKQVCLDWYTTYYQGTAIPVNKMVNIYNDRLSRVAAPAQRHSKVADIGRSQPKFEMQADPATQIRDMVEVFKEDSIKLDWLVDNFGAPAILAEMQRQGFARKEAIG